MKFYFCISLFFICKLGLSQEIIIEPQAQQLTQFAFKQYSGGVIMVRAKVGNIPDSLNFILDTGSGGISLDSSTCAFYKINAVASDTTIAGIGGLRKVSFVFDKTLHFPGLDVPHLNFHVNNYEVLTSVYGEQVDGIIGYSFFSKYIVALNYDDTLITVYKPGKFNYPKHGATLHPAFTSIPIQWANIKDRIKFGYNFYFDTGAGLCLLLSERFATDSSILLSKRKPVVTQAQGMAGKLQMRLSVIKEVKVGPYRFRQVPVYLYDDIYNVTSYPFTGGLIGNDLLRRFNVTINYPKREIHLIPNTHFKDAFDYAYTGLGVYYTAGKIMVEDVIDGSPAAKANFKVGDEIFAVGNNFTRNINTYKNLLQTPNANIKVIILRDKQAMQLLLQTKSIK
jgi:hypothetical protein